MVIRALKPRRPTPRAALTHKQLAFVSWYCSAEVNMNATEAARRAGYAGSDKIVAQVASENLRKPDIRIAIDERMRNALAGAEVTIEATLRHLSVIRERAIEAQQYSAAVRATELQGKYLGMFTDRIEHVQNIEDISNEELLRLFVEVATSSGIDFAGALAATPKER